MNGLSGTPIPVPGQIFLGIITGAVLALVLFHAVELWRRWRQHRLVAKLRREHWKCFDAAAIVKAKILAVGAVYEFTDIIGQPNGVFALCGCWHFDPGNGSLGYTQDSKGIIRMFGYTKAEVIYIAEHAKEFVDA